MAKKKLLVHLDLNFNELQNVILQPIASGLPASPKLGQIYFDSRTGVDTVYCWNGTEWLDLGIQGDGYTHTTGLTANPDLTGANVLASFQTNDEGHVTGVSTRALTLSDLGYTPYSHPTGAASIDTAGVEVVDALTFDSEGHVTGVTTRSITAAEFAAVIINDGAASGATQTWSIDKISSEIANAVTNGMVYKGGYNAGTNAPDLDSAPSGVQIGDTYTVTVAGTFFTTDVQVGDVLIAEADNATTEAEWTIVNKNIPDIVPATDEAQGIVELATQAEVDLGSDATRVVTPATLAGKLSSYVLDIASADSSVTVTDDGNGNYDLSVPAQVSDKFAVSGEDDTATANRLFNLDTYSLTLDSGDATWATKSEFTQSLINLQVSNTTNSKHSYLKLTETQASLEWEDADTNSYGVFFDVNGIKLQNKTTAITVPTSGSGFMPLTVNGQAADASGEITISIPTYSSATTEAEGLIELATQAEVDLGSDAVRAVTPATLAGKLSNYVLDIASADASVTVSNDGNGNYDLSVPPTSNDKFGFTGEDDTAAENRTFDLGAYKLQLSTSSNTGEFEFRADTASYLGIAEHRSNYHQLYAFNKASSDFGWVTVSDTQAAMTFFDDSNSYNNEFKVNATGFHFENGNQNLHVPFAKGGYFALSVNGQTADSDGEITLDVGVGTVTSNDGSITIDDTTTPGTVDLSIPASFPQKHTATIGDGASTSIAITHNLGSTFVMVQMREVSTNIMVECQVTYTDANTVTLGFNDAPASNDIEVTIIG